MPKEGPGIFLVEKVPKDEVMLYRVGSTYYFLAKLVLVPNPKEADFLVLNSGKS